ncbi:hypothetical protein GRJ2_003342900 [Grus japonensis]|uniref:Uncharacterized protein n=1 Tax=Grus japonensis TaxID=30415 RepID=A0ABC9YGS8_GRUJA
MHSIRLVIDVEGDTPSSSALSVLPKEPHILMSLRQMRRLEQTGHQVGFSVIHSGDLLLDDFQAGWIAHTSFEVHHRLALEDHFTAQLF